MATAEVETTKSNGDMTPPMSPEEVSEHAEQLNKTIQKISPKKRAAANGAADKSEPTPKKRNAGKGNTKVRKSIEENDMDGANEPQTPNNKQDAPNKSATPVKVKEETTEEPVISEDANGFKVTQGKLSKPAPKASPKNPQTPKTPKTQANNAEPGSAKGKTPKSASKETTGKEKSTPHGVSIPKSWDEATQADRMLCEMKDQGKSWTDIRQMWKTATGEDTGTSTLPNRYNRIKCNMQRLKPGHAQLLLSTIATLDTEHAEKRAHLERDFEKQKLEFEANLKKQARELEAKKWSSAAQLIETETGEKYMTEFLAKQWKVLKREEDEGEGGEDAGEVDGTNGVHEEEAGVKAEGGGEGGNDAGEGGEGQEMEA